MVTDLLIRGEKNIMANTTTINGREVVITGLDDDWSCQSDLGVRSIYCEHISFVPSDYNDRLIVEGAGFDTGVVGDLSTRTIYVNGWISPAITILDCTLGTPANAKVIIMTR